MLSLGFYFADIHADFLCGFNIVAMNIQQSSAFFDDFFQRISLCFAVFPDNHFVGFAFFQQFNGLGSENGGQHAIECGRDAGALQVAQGGNAGLKIGQAFVEFGAQILADAAVNIFADKVFGAGNMFTVFGLDAFGYDQNRVAAAGSLDFLEFFDNRINFVRNFGNQADVGAAGQSRVHGQVSGIAAHNFQNQSAGVGTGCSVQAVDGRSADLTGGVETD